MAYLGRQLTSGNYLKLDDISSQFNGSTKTFNLTSGGNLFYPGSAFSILVSLAGIIQEPESAYTIDQYQITFAVAPQVTDDFFCIALAVALGIGVPGEGTVSTSKLQDDSVTAEKLSSDALDNINATTLVVSGISTLGVVSSYTVFAVGVITATAFVGDGSGLTNLPGGGGAFAYDNTSNVYSCALTSLASRTDATDNFLVGTNAGCSIIGGYGGYYGSYNNFLGRNAGANNTTGLGNNFLGSNAGQYNTTGKDNNFFGRDAGFSNTDGGNNNFLGRSAGYYNTTGSFNNIIGMYAGSYNTTGSYNNFIGRGAGFSNTDGNCNNFIGRRTGFYNTTGNYNNFLGNYAGRSNTTGSNNIAIGFCAGTSGGPSGPSGLITFDTASIKL